MSEAITKIDKNDFTTGIYKQAQSSYPNLKQENIEVKIKIKDQEEPVDFEAIIVKFKF